MPIKFRCSYCRQFLGISRGRAGDVVDCPTCGRSIRVPRLDGVVPPVPSPELNLQDSKLVRALDELAHWNAPVAKPSAALETDLEDEEEIPQPLAEPIPIEVLVAPEPIAIKPPPAIEPASAASSSSAAAPVGEPSLSVVAALAELNQLAASPAAAVHELSPRFEAHQASPRLSAMTKTAMAMLLIAVFAAGYLSGWLIRPANVNYNSNGNTAVEPPPQTPAVSGRITYKTADGSSLPDRGARVLILPREREGTAKLSAVGFRAADHPADVRLATAALRALGGDFALTDDGGQFAIHIPNPGTFQIVVVSNYANRVVDEEIDPELIRQLSLYFEQPAQVLGRTKVHAGQVRYKGAGTEIWDHSF